MQTIPPGEAGVSGSSAAELSRLMFDESAVGYAEADPATARFVRVNRAFCRIVGRTETQLLQVPFYHITHPDDQPRDRVLFSELVAGRLPSYTVEKRYVRPNGVVVWCEVTVSVACNQTGQPMPCLAVVQDISARKEAEARLQDSEASQRRQREFLECVIANAGTCIAVVRGHELRYTMANPAFEAFAPDGVLVGKTFREVFPAAAAAGAEDLLRRVLKTGEPWEVNAYPAPIPGKPDAVWQGRVVRLPLDAESEGEPSVLAAVWDITARVRTEAALQASEQRFRALVTATSDVICRMNADWTELSYLRGQSFIRSPNLPERGWLQKYILPEDQPQILEAINQAIRTKTPFEMEHRFVRSNGTLGWAFSRMVPLLDVQGEITEWFGAASDISQRKQSEAELRTYRDQLQQLVADRTAQLQETIAELNHFSHSITHDMRTPLRTMTGLLDILEDELGNKLTPKTRDYLHRVRNSSQRMDHLITDALQYSYAGKAEMPMGVVDVKALLAGIIDSYPKMQPPQAHIQIAENIPAVVANEGGLTQCFSNLLGNAVKFVAPGVTPRVRIYAEPIASAEVPCPAAHAFSYVRFWIEDNGIGIKPSFHAKMFQMFQRASSSHEGTGIGLALAKKVTERMGGRIGFESAEGQGTRFWVILRLAVPVPPPPNSAP